MVRRRSKLDLTDHPGLFDLYDAGPVVTSPSTDDRAKADVVAEPEHTLAPLSAPKSTERLRFISFGSGSSGNCAYLGDDRFGILIDAGVIPDNIFEELKRYGIETKNIGGIILTHDHSDHVRYAYTIVRANRHMRIYCTPRTLNGILRRHSISRRIKDYHQPIFREIPFHLGNFTITPFETWHDGSDNVGFFIRSAAQTFVVATDMGAVSERADYYIRQANHLMIEADYDLEMLMHGSYPAHLKSRIISRTGHMDNKATAVYLASIYTPALRNVFLCHLSHDNNTPATALETVKAALAEKGVNVGDGSGDIASRSADIQVSVLPRFDSTGLIVLRND